MGLPWARRDLESITLSCRRHQTRENTNSERCKEAGTRCRCSLLFAPLPFGNWQFNAVFHVWSRVEKYVDASTDTSWSLRSCIPPKDERWATSSLRLTVAVFVQNFGLG